MLVRHCVEAANVDKYQMVVDPTMIKHVTLKAGLIDHISGFIDPLTHLNLDYFEHKVTLCVIADRLDKGGKMVYGDHGFTMAKVRESAYNHLGQVDYTKRLVDMRNAVKKMRNLERKEDIIK